MVEYGAGCSIYIPENGQWNRSIYFDGKMKIDGKQ
jgi:hypothetical protein